MKKNFEKLINTGKLAHGYIFFGPNTKDLKSFVDWLAGELEGEQAMFDYLIIDTKEDFIGIDRVREIKSFLWRKPARSSKRTVVINCADRLTVEAQNAILKITEEPPVSALIILLLIEPKNLIDTLSSRLQKFFIPPLDQTEKSSNLSIKKYVSDFLHGSSFQKKQVIKDILDQEGALSDFVKYLMLELNRDPIKNWQVLKELLKRWTLISQYNVNRRLQLEALSQMIHDSRFENIHES